MSRPNDQRLEDVIAAAHAIVQSTIDHDLPPLVAAVERLLGEHT